MTSLPAIYCYRCDQTSSPCRYTIDYTCTLCGSDFVEVISDENSSDGYDQDNPTEDDVGLVPVEELVSSIYSRLNAVQVETLQRLQVSETRRDMHRRVTETNERRGRETGRASRENAVRNRDQLRRTTSQNNVGRLQENTRLGGRNSLRSQRNLRRADVADRLSISSNDLTTSSSRNVLQTAFPTGVVQMEWQGYPEGAVPWSLAGSIPLNGRARQGQAADRLRHIKTETLNLDCASSHLIGETCVVCYDEYRVGDNVAHFPCRHVFHHRCARQWLESHDNCPLCRESVQSSHLR